MESSGLSFLLAMFIAPIAKPLLFIIILAWFFVIRKLVIRSIGFLHSRKYVKKIKYINLFTVIIFLIPFLPSSINAIYVEKTFPKLCEGISGYQPYNPVALDTIKNRHSAFEYLPLEGVEFTEWEMKGAIVDNLKNFEPGKYRLRFYTEGSKQCDLLRNNAPKAIEEYLRYNKRYKEKGYRLADRSGLCLGIQKIDKFKAKYKIETSLVFGEDTEFGYTVSTSKYDLIDLDADKVLSRFTSIRTRYSRPILAYFFTGGFSSKVSLSCPAGDYEPLKHFSRGNQRYVRYKLDEVKDSFFKMN